MLLKCTDDGKWKKVVFSVMEISINIQHFTEMQSSFPDRLFNPNQFRK